MNSEHKAEKNFSKLILSNTVIYSLSRKVTDYDAQ